MKMVELDRTVFIDVNRAELELPLFFTPGNFNNVLISSQSPSVDLSESHWCEHDDPVNLKGTVAVE